MKQLKLNDWQKGVEHFYAVVDLAPEDIENKLGVNFEIDFDDLDHFKACILEVENTQLVLRRYKRCPEPGTDLIGPTGAMSACKALLQRLGVLVEELTWVSPVNWNMEA